MSTRHEAEQKRAGALFRELMDQSKDHLRVGARGRDGTEVRLIDPAHVLHGPDGACTCCHGRTPRTQHVCPVCRTFLPRRLNADTHPTCEEQPA